MGKISDNDETQAEYDKAVKTLKRRGAPRAEREQAAKTFVAILMQGIHGTTPDAPMHLPVIPEWRYDRIARNRLRGRKDQENE